MDSDAHPADVRHLEALALHAHCATEAGSRSGGLRPNQDAYAVVEGVLSPQHVLASLLDGHGPEGHFIARHVRDRLPAWVASCVEEDRSFGAQSPPTPGWPTSRLIPRGFTSPPEWMQSSVGFLELQADGALQRMTNVEGTLPPGFPSACASLAAAFLLLDTDLCTRRSALLDASRVTCEQSGCAAVSALVCSEHIAVAACGDSSAFLAVQRPAAQVGSSASAESTADARRSPLRPRSPPQAGGVNEAPASAGPRYEALPMSVAHKVCGGEAERLRLQGGRVAAHSGEGHIPRVWPRAEDAVPGRPTYGLAVSRSFGDLHWKGVGVCASPDVVLRTIQPQDAFLLLCSDGVTDVMEGQQAVNIAADALHSGKEGSAANAALAVNEEAKRLWASRFPRSKRDDITCVVLPLRALSAETAK